MLTFTQPARRRLAALLVAVLAAVGLQATGTSAAPAAVPDQILWHDGQLRHTATSYAVTYPNGPTTGTWSGFQTGHAYAKLVISGKPSNYAMLAQQCLWKHRSTGQKYYYETCGPTKAFSANGVVWVDLGKPSTWWKKSTGWDWSASFSRGAWMVKSAASGKLMMNRSCGSSCYTGTNLSSHVPLNIDSEIILVRAGATFRPPTSWRGCPWAGCTP